MSYSYHLSPRHPVLMLMHIYVEIDVHDFDEFLTPYDDLNVSSRQRI